MNEQSSPFGNRESARQIRSASLRFVVLSILFANLVVGDGLASFTTTFLAMPSVPELSP